MIKRPKYLTRIEQIPQLSEDEKQALQPVSDLYAFRTNDYYQQLIDWNDPDDPIRRLVIPMTEELADWGPLDASCEELYTKVPGLEHKYQDTALLLVNDVCGAYCRYCFRKRLFLDDNDEVVRDVSRGLEYIREHPEISNILLTGGDPLLMSTSKLEPIIRKLREIPHVKIIRIGSKMPAFSPHRILDDPSLWRMFETYSTKEARIYLMAHFNHPRELTDLAREGLDVMHKHGAVIVNQTPIIRGINDDVPTLVELFDELSFMGVPPYYLFQCRPTAGNSPYSVPVEESYAVFLEAQTRCSGLAKRARFCMSHVTGKIEVAGMTDDEIIFRYHQAADPADAGRTMIFNRNPEAHWFDDYAESSCYLPKVPAQHALAVFQPNVGVAQCN